LKEHYYRYYIGAFISFCAFLLYLPSLKNGFVNWDDTQYLLENRHIQSIDPDFLRWAFFDFYADNWHPLTWLSHAADYALWGWNPLGHHLTNVILHAVNTFLVVVLALRLVEAGNARGGRAQEPPLQVSSRFTSQDSRFPLIASAVTGLLFGLHPIHVESVAWVSERKDLLCALFYLLAVLEYMSYMSHKTYRAYSLALFFFVLALMSKPMAVSLPVVLLILDWYPLRSWSYKKVTALFAEKLPFIILSIVSGVLTIMSQRSGNAIIFIYPLSARLFVAAESLFAYLGKMIWPVNLVPFYPYPENISFPLLTYVSVVALPFLITAACFAISKKHKWLIAVWGYFVVTLIPVLGIVQVGGQSMADRYTYLPGLGPFFMVGLVAAWAFNKIDALKKQMILFKAVPVAVIAVAVLSMAYLTFKQIQIWRSSIDLWSYVIEKEPGKVCRAYMNRSAAYDETGEYDKAIADYDTAVAIWPFDADVYYGRGKVFSKVRQFDKAVFNFDVALQLIQGGAVNDFGPELIYLYRGQAHLNSGHLELALKDFKKACDLGNGDGCRSLSIYGSNLPNPE